MLKICWQQRMQHNQQHCHYLSGEVPRKNFCGTFGQRLCCHPVEQERKEDCDNIQTMNALISIEKLNGLEQQLSDMKGQNPDLYHDHESSTSALRHIMSRV
ncbi:hypothetical protein Y032_0007g3364 [Ancylostoma ceylanicum]|uniref:Uncharacterized protein n=1 Tax=Ancylostoma ceylanicum TaxID=53326 RepID=A0A016VMQ3_9BILA|nr:hypothetical protein Y032_0007g3364 [Ancylostoma ceylanicum]